jgi:hypothetical protein
MELYAIAEVEGIANKLGAALDSKMPKHNKHVLDPAFDTDKLMIITANQANTRAMTYFALTFKTTSY